MHQQGAPSWCKCVRPLYIPFSLSAHPAPALDAFQWLRYSAGMFDPKFFDEMAQRLNASVPEGLRNLQRDVDRNLRASVQAALKRMDLVTREEFEVQAKLLARTRAKLDAMAQRVEQLEAQLLNKKQPDSTPPKSAPPKSTPDEQDMDGG